MGYKDIKSVVDYDDLLDLFTARLVGRMVIRAQQAPSDPHIVLELDEKNCVVGIEILGIHSVNPVFWHTHPDRGAIPVEIVAEVDGWFAQHT
jgi:hypothetical protein